MYINSDLKNSKETEVISMSELTKVDCEKRKRSRNEVRLIRRMDRVREKSYN